MLKIRLLLFGLLAPVLVIAMAAPLMLGHVAVRLLLLTRMRRAPRDLPRAAPEPVAAVRTKPALVRASCDASS